MSVLEPGKPCVACGVRPDVACRHRPAECAPIVRKDGEAKKKGAHDGFQGLRWKIAKLRQERSIRREKEKGDSSGSPNPPPFPEGPQVDRHMPKSHKGGK